MLECHAASLFPLWQKKPPDLAGGGVRGGSLPLAMMIDAAESELRGVES
jgi:hypothetical protein